MLYIFCVNLFNDEDEAKQQDVDAGDDRVDDESEFGDDIIIVCLFIISSSICVRRCCLSRSRPKKKERDHRKERDLALVGLSFQDAPWLSVCSGVRVLCVCVSIVCSSPRCAKIQHH